MVLTYVGAPLLTAAIAHWELALSPTVSRSLTFKRSPQQGAFEKRIKACVALSGPFNWGAV
jgi:hypothetical protein